MRINKIDLKNIGPYAGKNKINFDGLKSNITIFGGKNGSGKTTLFNLIKISIYGYRSLGYITQNKSYNEFIEKMINDSAKSQKLSASSSIEIEYIKNFRKNIVKISRVWDYPSYHEAIDVYLNGTKLPDSKKYQKIDEVHELFPLKLLKINLFDGEAINSLTQQSEFYDFIESIIFSYFNLDIIDSLEKDFQKYLKTSTDQNLSLDEVKLKNLILENNTKKKYRTELVKKIENNSVAVKNINSKLTGLNLKILESELISEEQYNTNIKLSNSINENYKKSLAEYLESLSEDIILKFFNKELNSIVNNFKKNIDEILAFQRSQLFTESIISHENFLFNLDISKVNNISKLIKLYKVDSINKSFIKVNKAYNERITINENLRKNINQEFYDNLKALERELEHLDSERLDLEKLHIATDEVILNNEIKIKDLNTAVIKNSRSLKSVSKTYEYLKLLEDFVHNEMNLLTKKVSTKSTEIISKIKNFNYHRVYIDSVSRKIQLDNGDLTGIDKLSAGERQMVLLTLLKSIIEISEKNFPVIFDTPIARLDMSNKNEFLKLMTSFDNNQIVVFSTDRELDNDILEFNHLKNSNFYSIENTKGVSKIISDRYFEDWS